jgi:hypothetical protein
MGVGWFDRPEPPPPNCDEVYQLVADTLEEGESISERLLNSSIEVKVGTACAMEMAVMRSEYVKVLLRAHLEEHSAD